MGYIKMVIKTNGTGVNVSVNCMEVNKKKPGLVKTTPGNIMRKLYTVWYTLKA